MIKTCNIKGKSTGFDPQAIQPKASRWIEYTIPAHM